MERERRYAIILVVIEIHLFFPLSQGRDDGAGIIQSVPVQRRLSRRSACNRRPQRKEDMVKNASYMVVVVLVYKVVVVVVVVTIGVDGGIGCSNCLYPCVLDFAALQSRTSSSPAVCVVMRYRRKLLRAMPHCHVVPYAASSCHRPLRYRHRSCSTSCPMGQPLLPHHRVQRYALPLCRRHGRRRRERPPLC
jgi:hypothetical protein